MIEIKTGDAKNVGNVYLSIYGSKLQIEKVHLNENKIKKTGFEKNKLDEFEINGIDVGDVIKLYYFSENFEIIKILSYFNL